MKDCLRCVACRIFRVEGLGFGQYVLHCFYTVVNPKGPGT